MTDKEIVATTNSLAHNFYGIHGNQRPPAFKFYEATHPQEALMWRLACEAMIRLRCTDPADALSTLDD